MEVFRLSSEAAISARITTYLVEKSIPVRLPVKWITISKMYLRNVRAGKSVVRFKLSEQVKFRVAG